MRPDLNQIEIVFSSPVDQLPPWCDDELDILLRDPEHLIGPDTDLDALRHRLADEAVRVQTTMVALAEIETEWRDSYPRARFSWGLGEIHTERQAIMEYRALIKRGKMLVAEASQYQIDPAIKEAKAKAYLERVARREATAEERERRKQEIKDRQQAAYRLRRENAEGQRSWVITCAKALVDSGSLVALLLSEVPEARDLIEAVTDLRTAMKAPLPDTLIDAVVELRRIMESNQAAAS